MCLCMTVQDLSEDVFLRRHKKHEEDEKRRKRCVKIILTIAQCTAFSYALLKVGLAKDENAVGTPRVAEEI